MLRGVIKYRGILRENLDKEQFNQMLGQSLIAAAYHWHQKYLPLHFQSGADSRYGYKDRTEKYLKKKQRYYKHQLPLTFTGTLKKMLLNPTAVSAKAIKSGKRASMPLKGPAYFYQYHKGKQADKAAEVTKVRIDETQDMAKVVDDNLTKLVNSSKTAEERRVA